METNDCLKTIKKYSWLIFLIAILSAVSAWAVSKYFIAPQYESSALVVISYTDSGTSGLNAAALPDSNTLRLFYNIVKSDTAIEKTRDALQLDVPMEDMQKLINTEMDYDTGAMMISTKTESAEQSEKIVNTFINTIKTELANLFSNLQIYVVDEPKLADTPTSPNIPLNIALSALGGMMAAALAILLFCMKEQTRMDLSALGKFPNLFIMGYFPKSRAKKMMPFCLPIGERVDDTARMIGANLQYLIERNSAKTVLITSPDPKEGKSTLSMHLASAMALSGKKVLVADCNVDNPSYYLIETMRAFSMHKNSHHMIGEYVVKTVPDLGIDMTVVPHEGSYIQFDKLHSFFETMEQHYDLILADCPSIANADTMMFLNFVKNVVLVADYRKLSYFVLEKCINQLTQISAFVLGIVVNRIPEKKLP